MSRAGAPLVVIGDALLDVDVTAHAARLSPEAPVPVLSDPVRRSRPGGAALAALLAARTYPQVVLVTGLPRGAASEELLALLGTSVDVIGVPAPGSLPVKTRWRAGSHPIARLDEGGRTGPLGILPAAAAAALRDAAAVLVADYGGGITADEQVRAALTGLTCPLVWDPHPRGAPPVRGCWLVTPNLGEALAAVRTATGVRDEATSAGPVVLAARSAAALVPQWRARGVAVTLGGRGALLAAGDGAPLLIPARRVAAEDTCGAGDAFAAAAVCELAGGALTSAAVESAVRAAADFVEQGGAARLAATTAVRGVGPVGSPAGMTAATSRPVQGQPLPDPVALAEQVRAAGGTVVATGGCFDLLHPGHVSLLEAARSLGDVLIVCLNSDDSVRRMKGPARPLQPEADRARILAGLRSVDAVLIFDEDTPVAALHHLRPQVWVKGGDYTGAVLPEAAQLASWGAQAVTVPFLPGRSTTALVQQAAAPA